MRLPGTRLLAIARLWLDEGAIDRVFTPLVADWQHQYLHARSGRGWARVYLSGLLAFTAAAVQLAPRALLAWPPPGTRRTVTLAATGFAAVGVAINVALMPHGLNYPGHSWLFILPAFLIASATLAVLPVALLVCVRTGGSRRGRLLTAQVIVAHTAVVILAGGWIVPETNQQWRVIAFRSQRGDAIGMTLRQALVHLLQTRITGSPDAPDVPRGVHELSTSALFARDAAASWGVAAAEISGDRHNRAALALLPTVLGMLGWGLGRVSIRAPLSRAILWWTLACVVVVVARAAATSFSAVGWPPGTVAWVPVAAFATAALVTRAGGGRAEGAYVGRRP